VHVIELGLGGLLGEAEWAARSEFRTKSQISISKTGAMKGLSEKRPHATAAAKPLACDREETVRAECDGGDLGW
jgi:hypothetical protein